ncbi:hypothetical protein Fmac_021682 [Flemingia macrophylla]|uniref:Uncharacterized protein n=1 Tax=Flemingia macrophylla TaxID=520843 RepID=A0ABD1LXK7_9FABA
MNQKRNAKVQPLGLVIDYQGGLEIMGCCCLTASMSSATSCRIDKVRFHVLSLALLMILILLMTLGSYGVFSGVVFVRQNDPKYGRLKKYLPKYGCFERIYQITVVCSLADQTTKPVAHVAINLLSGGDTHLEIFLKSPMLESELHDFSDDADYAASQQQGSASIMLHSDSSKQNSPRDGGEIIFSKDNVTINPTQFASERISGRLILTKQSSALFMNWIPHNGVVREASRLDKGCETSGIAVHSTKLLSRYRSLHFKIDRHVGNWFRSLICETTNNHDRRHLKDDELHCQL